MWGYFCAQPFVKRVAGTAECIGRKISDFSEWRKAVAKIICSAENNYCVSMVIHLMKAPAKIQVVAGLSEACIWWAMRVPLMP